MATSIRTTCATAALFVLAAEANAEILTVEYEAVLDPGPFVGWPAGVVISGRYTFDSEDPGGFEDPNVKAYEARHTATIAGVPVVASDPRIYVWNDHTTSDTGGDYRSP